MLLAVPGTAAAAMVTLFAAFPGLAGLSPFDDLIGFGFLGLVAATSAIGGYLAGTGSVKKEVRIASGFAGLLFGTATFVVTMVTLWGNFLPT